MNYRLAQILAEEAASTAATKTIDINVNKPISRIVIRFRATNGVSLPVGHPQNMITKVELVDGSNPLYSLSGIEAQALNFYERGFLPPTLMEYKAAQMCSAVVEINFGRFLWDELLAFDPKKFNNPQLRITHNLALGGSTPTSATLVVEAFCFDEKVPAPVGFLMSKEQYSYTLVASAKEKVELAVDMPYRYLLLKSLTSGNQPYENYHDIKLSEDNDNRVIINNEAVSLLEYLLMDHPPITEMIGVYDADAGLTVYCTPSMALSVVALGQDSADAALFTNKGYGGTFVLTGTTIKDSQVIVAGRMPHATMLIPFGNKDKIEDWYNLEKVGKLDLTITGGSGASGTCEVFSQQLRKY